MIGELRRISISGEFAYYKVKVQILANSLEGRGLSRKFAMECAMQEVFQ